jgi:hypothetical protein
MRFGPRERAEEERKQVTNRMGNKELLYLTVPAYQKP